MDSQNQIGNLSSLFGGAAAAGTISPETASLLTGNLGPVVIAGAAGTALEDIVASDVTLITVLIDASSSIACSNLEQAVRDGQNSLVDAFAAAKESPSILMALWIFNHDINVVHSFVPVSDAERLGNNYRGNGATRLYDCWCDALAANVAYAQALRDGGTPCKSVIVVITDGGDYGSQRTAGQCKKLSGDLLKSEQFILAFVGVGDEIDFRKVAKSMGVPDGCVAVQKDVRPTELRKLFQMVSQSAIRASQGRIQPGASASFFTP